jgi:protein-S-isoprenylcysteine O-methyltransferase Ste14
MVTLRSLLFTILLPGTVTGFVPWLLLQWSGEAVWPGLSIWLLGLIPLLVGLGLFFWCDGLFTFVGKGTLAPISPTVFLVRGGPYQWMRNPMYVSVFTVIVGEAILFHSLLLFGYALLVLTLAHLFVIFYEEPTLRRQFGASYETYLRSVPRWIPRRV